MAADLDNKKAPEVLYHIKRTIIDYAVDRSGSIQTTDVLSTLTDLDAAKAAARAAILQEGYAKDDFAEYEENDGTDKWKYDEEAMIVVAKAPTGQEFKVSLDTTLNKFPFKMDSHFKVTDHLQYGSYYLFICFKLAVAETSTVLQTTIFYNQDRSGGIQTVQIEGVYPTRKEAREAAKSVLLDENTTRTSFVEYDEQDKESKEWPYGEDVLVHAVMDTGENIKISVKPQPHSHHQHASVSHAA